MTSTGTRTPTITMPLPSPLLTPNLRLHWRARARHARQQREAAFLWTRYARGWRGAPTFLPDPLFPGPVRLDVTVRPRPRMKRLDDDNLWGALKATRDGIADALGVDDKCFVIGALTWSTERTGELVVTLTGEEE